MSSSLILPDSEPTNAKLILPPQSRRGFMKTLTAAFTGLVVAPAIVPAANLMQIHSPDNKLIVAFYKNYKFMDLNKDVYPSLLNLTDWSADSFRAWEYLHPSNAYSLVRQGAIPAQNEGRFGGRKWYSYAPSKLEQEAEIKRNLKAEGEQTRRAIERHFERERRRQEDERAALSSMPTDGQHRLRTIMT